MAFRCRWLRNTFLVHAALSCLVAAAWPVASVRAAPSAAERETARSLMDEGDRLQAAGDLQGAMARYQSAHAIMHVPTTGFSLASVQAQLGLLVEARSAAIEVINLPVAAAEPKVFTQARRAAGALATELEPRIPSIKVSVTPADVVYTLSIDNVTLPAEARLVAFRTNPGAHLVRIDAPGYTTEMRDVTLAEGQLGAVSVNLQPMAAAPPAVVSPAPAPAWAAPPAPPAAVADGVDDPAAAGQRLRGIVAVSAGGAVLLAGTVTGIVSFVQTQHEKDTCFDGHCLESQEDALSTANALANVANICIPIGALGLAYGLYELLSLPSAPAANARSGSVRFAFTGTGAMVRGSL